MKLSAENVHMTFLNCLIKQSEAIDSPVIAEGIQKTVHFHPDRIAVASLEIAEMLDGLSDDFKPSGGGGMSFLNMCNDATGEQWTGFHSVMEELFLLGKAIGKASFLMPREMWSIFPGGMPYILVRP